MNSVKKVYLILVIIALSATWFCNAKPMSDIGFTHIDTQSGLPSNCVRDIKQDSQGFMWFATDGGLVRHDGREMRIFDISTTNFPGDSIHGFHDNFIATIYELNGVLWIGEESGLYRYDPHTELVQRVQGPYFDLPVQYITGDREGNLWIATATVGIIRYNPEFGTSRIYQMEEWNNIASMILVDSSNNVWAVSNLSPNGLKIYNKASDRFDNVRIKDSSGLNIDTSALSISEDSDNNMWLGTIHEGLICFDPYNRKILDRKSNPWSRNISHIHSIIEIEPGIIAFGTNSGLGLVDNRSGEMKMIVTDELDKYSLSNNFVYPITLDEEGGLWVGTFYGGVNYFPPQLKPFAQYLSSAYKNSVNGNVISRFGELNDGRIAIASDDGGLSLLNPATGEFTTPDIFPRHHSNNIHALATENDNLWIGSYGNGITMWNVANGTTKSYTSVIDHQGKDIDNLNCYALYFDSKGDLWAGTMAGINRKELDADRFVREKEVGTTVIDIKESPTGELLFATQGAGLIVKEPDGTWVNYRANDHSGLPHDHVNSIAIAPDDKIYIATSGGLVEYNPQAKNFSIVETGIENPVVLSVLSDQHTLWLSTPKGLWRVIPGVESKLFGINDGITGDQTAANTLFKSSDGRIYAGSTHGFTAFYPYQLKNNPYIPPLVLTGLKINHEDFETYSSNGQEVSINDLQELEMPYGNNSVTVKFSSLSYVNPEDNHYRYRLEGLEKDWIENGNQNSVTYTNLSPGSYILNIQGSNNDGLWNPEIRQLKITVMPPWWSSWWMNLIYLVIICGSIIAVWLWLSRRTNRQHAIDIERLERKKEREVYDAKMRFFTMIAHEIRTPVSLIKGPLEKILSNSGSLTTDQKDDLEVISRNNMRLLNLVNQLLDFKKVEHADLVNEFIPTDIPSLIQNIAERFVPSMEKKGLTLRITGETDPFNADIDTEAFTKLMSNLLNNARKYGKSSVTVNIQQNPNKDVFVITVADDGPGIPTHAMDKIFDAFYRPKEDIISENGYDSEGGSGIGLNIVKNVTEAHSGNISVYNSPNGGAVFQVTLPLKQEREPKILGRVDANGEEKPLMLFVDDNLDMVRFIEKSFSQEYRVITARDGIEALEILKTSNPDIIVSDWMMPKMNGLQLCQTIRNNSSISHLPFVMLTAKADDVSKTEGNDIGVDGYVEKPFSVSLLGSTIRNVIGRRRLLQKKYTSQPLEPLTSVALTPNDADILKKLENIIKENIANQSLSVDFLAEKLRISRSTLYNKIKTLADITPNELIQLTRLKRAAELLQEGNFRVNEICYMVGFNSPSYFAKCFQKQFGVKPNDFNRLSPGGSA